MQIPINLTLQRKSFLPVVEATMESTTISMESKLFMIEKSIEIIEEASKFNGKPIEGINNQEITNMSSKSQLIVSFAIIFPSSSEIDSFFKHIQQN